MDGNDITTIKGYEVRERIGAGGFGVVYRAFQSTVGREVAIKVILPGYANHPEFIRRFESEAQLIARLEHLHIVPLYDYWRDAEGAYLVMRLLRGGSLQDALKHGPYDLEAAATLLDQIASALTTAHRAEVIHRDIKPSNILLDEDGNAYLSDFGIAKDLTSGDTIMTSPDALIGSPDYLSPEQARSEIVTPQTDIYSLGILLYEMLSGAHPFPDLSPVELLFKHINEPLPQITTLEMGVSEAINAVVQKATAKNPNERYPDVLVMAAAFREAAALVASQKTAGVVALLTPREQAVLQHIVEGRPNREIAEAMHITLNTLKSSIRQMYSKLNVRSRPQAVARARELRLLEDVPGEPVRTGIEQLLEPENPYKGLRAFQSIDAGDFFGREKLTARLLKRLGETGEFSRFLAVIGPSGSGKSSLVRAGLIPALLRGELPGSEDWYIVDMVPGTHPLDELEVALTRVAVSHAEGLREQLGRDERGLVRAAQLILPQDDSQLLLVIDQFEELFTLIDDEAARAHFIALLQSAVSDKRSRVRVVITLRADFYDRPLHYPGFGALVRERMETVLPMSAEELELAIARPAERTGVHFEEGLVAHIIDEVHYQPGALPLLQYALTELFDSRVNRMLTLEAYQGIGGAVGALAKRAEEVYIGMDPDGREAARQMFLRLVTLGESLGEGARSPDTRRRVPRSELLGMVGDSEVMDEVIDTYAAYRLLSLDHDPATRTPTVEVAHEAIWHEWTRLGDWLEAARDDIRVQRQLSRAARDWRGSGEEASFLLRGSRLDQFASWAEETALALTADEHRYLEASQHEQEREAAEEAARQERELALEARSRRTLQALVGVFAVATVLAVILSIVAFNQRGIAQAESSARGTAEAQAVEERDRAVSAEQEALVQASIGLALRAEAEMGGLYPERGVLLALEVLEHYPYTWQAERALGNAVMESRLRMILKHEEEINLALWSPDGEHILTASDDDTARIWDALSGEALFTLSGHSDDVLLAGWSPNGGLVVTAGPDGSARLWDSATGQELFTLLPVEAGPSADPVPITALAFNPDGSALATGSENGTVKVWGITEVNGAIALEALHTLSGHRERITSIAWSPDGSRVITGCFWEPHKVWDAFTGSLQFEIAVSRDGNIWENSPISVWSPDGGRVFTTFWHKSGLGGYVHANRVVAEGETELLFRIPTEGTFPYYQDIQLAPDGARLATFGIDELVVWDAISGEQLYRLGGSLQFGVMAWSQDGAHFVTGGQTGEINVWDAQSGTPQLSLQAHRDPLTSISWSPTGDRILSASTDGTAKVWSVGEAPLTLPGLDTVLCAAWSPAGEHMAVTFFDGTINIYQADTGEVINNIRDNTLFHAGFIEKTCQLSWSADGRRFVIVSKDPIPRVWDVTTGERAFFLLGHSDIVADVAWSPQGERIATSSLDGTVRIWDANTGGELLAIPTGGNQGVSNLDWSPDGKRIMLSSYSEGGSSIKVWDADSGELLIEFYPDAYRVLAAAWSPDGERIAAFCDDDTIRVWPASLDTALMIISHVNYPVGQPAWSTSGECILAGSGDGLVTMWKASTGDELLHLDFGEQVEVLMSPDGGQMAVVRFGEGSVSVFPMWGTLEELQDFARDCCVVRELIADERAMYGLPEGP